MYLARRLLKNILELTHRSMSNTRRCAWALWKAVPCEGCMRNWLKICKARGWRGEMSDCTLSGCGTEGGTYYLRYWFVLMGGCACMHKDVAKNV
jgi:hypothetical protein